VALLARAASMPKAQPLSAVLAQVAALPPAAAPHGNSAEQTSPDSGPEVVELVAEAADYIVDSEPQGALVPMRSWKVDAGLLFVVQSNKNEWARDIEAAYMFEVPNMSVGLSVWSSFVVLTVDAAGNCLGASSFAGPVAPDGNFSGPSYSPSIEKSDPDSGAAQGTEQSKPSPALSWRPPLSRS
jgi:hypothetical protein